MKHITFFGVLFSALACWSQMENPLASGQHTEEYLHFTWKSDLFLDPDSSKTSPFKAYQLKLNSDIWNSPSSKGNIYFNSESLSLGKPGIAVGSQHVLVNNVLVTRRLGLENTTFIGFDHEIFSDVSYGTKVDEEAQRDGDVDLDVNIVYFNRKNAERPWFIQLHYSKNRGYLNSQPILNIGYTDFLLDYCKYTISFLYFDFNYTYDAHYNTFIYLSPNEMSITFKNTVDMKRKHYAKLTKQTESFFHANRTEENLRLIHESKSFELGSEFYISELSELSLFFGYAFGRSLYEAKTIYSPQGPKTHFNSDIYAGFSWRYF